jgi:hypothetical protein
MIDNPTQPDNDLQRFEKDRRGRYGLPETATEKEVQDAAGKFLKKIAETYEPFGCE